MKVCTKCGKEKSLDLFSTDSSRSLGIGSQCKECKNASTYARRNTHRKIINDAKIDSGCTRCGYKEHPEALTFHHLDPSEKIFSVVFFLFNMEV